MDSETHEYLIRETLKQQRVLKFYAYTLLKDWYLAEDAVQETLITVSTKKHNYTERHKISGWLKKITYCKCMNIIKQNKEMTVADEELLTIIDQGFDNYLDEYQLLQYEKKRRILHSCLSLLERNSMDILMGFYRDRLSCSKLSSQYNRTVNAIRLKLSRTRKILNKCISKNLSSEQFHG
ncbi:MAG: sigma-70 family RNA polymerase sigma factor [Lentisphaeraceae bacterium]|nr:sigma-70 family RNA polymerase sigma factor [Lentisphaeraceae bacterium]